MTLQEKVSRMFDGYVKPHVWKKLPDGKLIMVETESEEVVVYLTEKEGGYDLHISLEVLERGFDKDQAYMRGLVPFELMEKNEYEFLH